MSRPHPPAPALGIPTRDLILAFILAKLCAIVVAAILEWRHPGGHPLFLPLAHILAATLFVLLIMQGGRQSLPEVMAATSLRCRKPGGHPAMWLAVALLAGVLVRLGNSGFVLATLQCLDPDAAAAEFADLLASYREPASRMDLLLIAIRLVGAAEEELTYRRILLSHFSGKWGLVAGIVGTSALFGALHLEPQACVAGLCLALLYLISGRLWVVILAHAAINLTFPALGTLEIPLSRAPFFIACHAAAVLLTLAVILAFRSVRRADRRDPLPPFAPAA